MSATELEGFVARVAREFVCDLAVGNRSFQLALKISPAMDGWIYSVFDVSNNCILVPESPVPDRESGRHCAEAIILENFAFSQIKFNWRTKPSRP
jgi:hypothetical protein